MSPSPPKGDSGTSEARRRIIINFDPCTFKGRINIALDSLKNMYPHQQIILMAPLHRDYAKIG